MQASEGLAYALRTEIAHKFFLGLKSPPAKVLQGLRILLGTQGVLVGLFNIVVLLIENVLKSLQEMDIILSIGVHLRGTPEQILTHTRAKIS